MTGSHTKFFENMGHDIPLQLLDAIVLELIANFGRNAAQYPIGQWE